MATESDLEIFIDEGIRRSVEKGYTPTTFLEMRKRWGTQGAIKRLVVKADIQSGFERAVCLGLAEWTLEAAVLKFPSLFGKPIREAAKFRLEQTKIHAKKSERPI